MQTLSHAEASLLFSKTELLHTGQLLGVVLFHEKYKPTASQADMIGKMLHSIGLKHGFFQSAYYGSGNSQLQLEAVLASFSPKITLVFAEKPEAETEITIKKLEGTDCVHLPHPEAIESNLEIKKAVWKTLKPLALT